MRPYHFFLRREGVRGISLLVVFLFHQCLRKLSATSFYVVFCHLFLCSCPIELISTYLDKIMAPSVKTLLSYIYGTANTRLKFFRNFARTRWELKIETNNLYEAAIFFLLLLALF